MISSIAGGVQPLVKAMVYPDRQVRYLAAVTLAKSLPDTKFTGMDLVAPVLNEALPDRGQAGAGGGVR